MCLSFLQTGAQDDQFAPISIDDRIQHFSGVSQSKFQGAPRPTQRQQPQQFQPQQGQFQSQTQQFRPQQQSFQPQQQQNFLPQQQQNFPPQQQQFQSQQQQFQPQQQQFQPQQQQFQSQQQQFQPQQQQPLSTEALQESLKQSLQKSLQQQIQSFQQPQPVQEFPPGAQVPNTELQVQTPEHIRQFQKEVGASQQPKHPITVFGNPSEPAETQFRKPATAQFQQQQSQFQPQQSNNFQQQSRQFQPQLTNQFQQQQPNSFQQPGASSQQSLSQNTPFTAFSQNQQVAPNGQQSPRSFQSQGQQQFAPELPRSSQQFQPRPQIGAFDQIKTAITTGRRFSPQQVQFPQRQQPITQPPTTTQPPPKFMPLNAVPPGSEQIGTHKKLENTVINQETKDKIESIEKSSEETSKEVSEEKQERNTADLKGFIQKVVVQTIAGKKTKEEEKEDNIETVAIVEELNNILELLSKPSSIKSKINNIASIKKSKKKPETSLIRIQENLLGLSGIGREEDSEETRSSNSSEDISELLNLLSKSSKKKSKKTSKSSFSTLEEKILKLSSREDESEDLLSTIKEKKRPKEVIRDEDDDLSAVQEALSKLLGSKPAEDSKISPEVFSVVLQLDDFFKEEEKQKSRKINEVENLIDTALGFIDGAVTRREHAEKRLIDGEPVFDYDDYYGELLDSLDLSPSELRKLLKA